MKLHTPCVESSIKNVFYGVFSQASPSLKIPLQPQEKENQKIIFKNTQTQSPVSKIVKYGRCFFKREMVRDVFKTTRNTNSKVPRLKTILWNTLPFKAGIGVTYSVYLVHFHKYLDFLGAFQKVSVFRAFPSCSEVQGLKVIANQQTPETYGCTNIFKTESGTTWLLWIRVCKFFLHQRYHWKARPNSSQSQSIF